MHPPPVRVTWYVKFPETAGDPEMVSTLEAHADVTPAGNPVTVAPVAPVVAYVIFVIGYPVQKAWLSVFVADVRLIEQAGAVPDATVILPVLLAK